jgi:hypothetical protein
MCALPHGSSWADRTEAMGFLRELLLYGVLRSSRWAWPGGIMLVVERGGPWGFLQGGREGEDDEEEAHSNAKRAAPLRGAGGLRAGGDGAGTSLILREGLAEVIHHDVE